MCEKKCSVTTIALVVAIVATCVGTSGCRYESNLHLPPPGAPAEPSPYLKVQRKYDRETGRLIFESTVLLYPKGFPVKNGKELTWYPSGAKEWEREYKRDQPVGTWRSWYESGAQRSEVSYDESWRGSVMTFWHPNGQMSAQGFAQKGSRNGDWKFWHENGELAEEGIYVDDMREGIWLTWNSDGAKGAEIRYEHNIRVPIAKPTSDVQTKHNTRIQ